MAFCALSGICYLFDKGRIGFVSSILTAQFIRLAEARGVTKSYSSENMNFKIKIRVYKTIILPVVPDSCETLPLTLSEELILRSFRKEDPEANIWTQKT